MRESGPELCILEKRIPVSAYWNLNLRTEILGHKNLYILAGIALYS
jgi:hypothetical protein